MKKFIIASALVLTSVVLANAEQKADFKCMTSSSKVKELNAEIQKRQKELDTVSRVDRVHHLVRGGKCIQRARKMHKLAWWIVDTLTSDYLNNDWVEADLADIEDALACLKIQRYEELKKCSCQMIGQPFDMGGDGLGNPPLEDAIYGTYDRMEKMNRKYIKLTTSDRGIREWIMHARDIHDCINHGVLKTLQNTEQQIAKLLGLPPPDPINPPPVVANLGSGNPPPTGGTSPPVTVPNAPGQRDTNRTAPTATPRQGPKTKGVPGGRSPRQESTITGTIGGTGTGNAGTRGTATDLFDKGGVPGIPRIAPPNVAPPSVPKSTTPNVAPHAPAPGPTTSFLTPGTPRPPANASTIKVVPGGITLKGKVVGEFDKNGMLDGVENEVLHLMENQR
jgi:hypothetical protein